MKKQTVHSRDGSEHDWSECENTLAIADMASERLNQLYVELNAKNRRTIGKFGDNMENNCGLRINICKLDYEQCDTKSRIDALEAEVLALKEVGRQQAKKIMELEADNRELNHALSKSKERTEFAV